MERIERTFENDVMVSATLNLQFPIDSIQNQGEKIHALTFQRPKNKHIKNMSAAPTMNDLQIVGARLAGLTPREADELDACDAIAVAEIIGDFLSPGRETGRT